MITLSAGAFSALEQALEKAYPDEGCGLLIGRWETDSSSDDGGRGGNCLVEDIAESVNLANDPQRHFEVDPRLQLKLQKELRAGPTRVVGVFHSHPDGAPLPSDTDRARAYDPDLVWLIAAVQVGRLAQINAFRPGDPGEQFQQIHLLTAN
jgi:proteasome lid subunit RPN8/RPN11